MTKAVASASRAAFEIKSSRTAVALSNARDSDRKGRSQMTAPISSLGIAGPAPNQSSTASLDRDAFLTLLVAQLRNQDPFSTLEPHEFAAQLAQFSSVEQLTNLNDAVAIQNEATQLATFLSETSLSASLLGRQIVAVGSQVQVTAEVDAMVQVEVGGQGGSGKLQLFDEIGREVATVDLGNLAPGRQTLSLPPDTEPGMYTYAVTVEGGEGVTIPVVTYTTGVVDGVYFRDGDIVLRIGSMEVPLDALAEIQSAPQQLI
jgi:flagellar basal-body rod modification protein FlgD